MSAVRAVGACSPHGPAVCSRRFCLFGRLGLRDCVRHFLHFEQSKRHLDEFRIPWRRPSLNVFSLFHDVLSAMHILLAGALLGVSSLQAASGPKAFEEI